jgi:hypothetical protein
LSITGDYEVGRLYPSRRDMMEDVQSNWHDQQSSREIEGTDGDMLVHVWGTMRLPRLKQLSMVAFRLNNLQDRNSGNMSSIPIRTLSAGRAFAGFLERHARTLTDLHMIGVYTPCKGDLF